MSLNLVYWIIAGVIATSTMSIFQLFLIKFEGKKAVPEFYENAKILSTLFKKPWEQIYWYAVSIHYLHGITGAIGLGLILFLYSIELSVVVCIVFSIILWIVLLIIHKPITGECLYDQKTAIVGSFFSHQIYGLTFLFLY